MPNKKISQLPLVDTSILDGSEPLPIEQGGIAVQITLQQLVASGAIGGISRVIQVAASRDYLSTDAGAILDLAAGVVITMPVGELFPQPTNIAIFTLSQTAGYETTLASGTIFPAVGQSPLGSELVILSSFNTAGQTGFLQLGSGYKLDTNDSKVKTFDRYMLDNLGVIDLENGLTKTAGVGKLGGDLTEDTVIDGTTNTKSFAIEVESADTNGALYLHGINSGDGFGVNITGENNGSTRSGVRIIGTNSGAGADVIISGGKTVISNTVAPAAANSTGIINQIAFDSNYIYYCVAANTWKRTLLSTW